jgi:hypothetical protein
MDLYVTFHEIFKDVSSSVLSQSYEALSDMTSNWFCKETYIQVFCIVGWHVILNVLVVKVTNLKTI